jgi:outer membrane lipoprotein-sorting protein
MSHLLFHRCLRVAFGLLLSVAVLPVALSAQTMSAEQSQQKADAILDKFLTASGELAAMENIKTRRDKGRITLPGIGISGDVEVLAKAPNKTRMTMTIAGVGQIIEAFDGDTAWVQDPIQGYREKTDLELSATKRQSDFYMAANYKQHYPKREWVGAATIEGKQTDRLRLHPTEGDPEEWYIDRATNLLIRMDSVSHLPQGDIASQVYLEDYKQIDGVMEPMRLRIVNALAPVTMEMSSSESNVELDDALFLSPRKRGPEEIVIIQ